MVKGTKLWDDSALISAFDAAMTSYKEMHTECSSGHALDKEKDGGIIKERDTVLTEEANCGRQIESEGNNLNVENNMKETCASSCNTAAATNDPFTLENDIGANCFVPEFNPVISEHPNVNPIFDGYSDDQILNYNELLKEYNELEHRKEKIVEQLWQANYRSYQSPVQCPTNQQQQASVNSGSELGPNNSCPWCKCQCLATSSSISNCPIAIALSAGYACCPQQILCCSGSQIQQGEQKNEDDASGKDFSSTSQKPDLTSVINAWYWAGYHTGRYLLEQEQSDKQNNNTGQQKQHTDSEEKGGCT